MSSVEPSRDWISYAAECNRRLKVVFVGMNPSDESWRSVAPYANETNKMWPLLREAGFGEEEELAPGNFANLPAANGIGFCDLFVVNESDSTNVGRGVASTDIRADFLHRLKGAVEKPPHVIALVCKNVCSRLLDIRDTSRIEYGKVGCARSLLGSAWFTRDVEVWLLPCTSGRASQSPFEEKASIFATLSKYLDELH